MDRRRMALWGIFVTSLVVSVSTLWPSGTGPAPAETRVVATTPAAAPAASAAGAQPVPALLGIQLDLWRSRLDGNLRDPFFTAAELAAMSRRPGAVVASVDEPTVTFVPPAPALPDYTLKLTMSTGAGARALIGNQVVTVGDMLGDERVVEILPDTVVLEREGERRQVQRARSVPAFDRIHVERVR